MSGLHEVKKRIQSIEKTKKITNAMEMVAGAKLYKASAKLHKIRDMFEAFYSVLTAADFFLFPEENLLWQGKQKINNTGLLVLSSDRGLCGSFNTFIFKELQHFLIKKKNVKIIMIGKKGIAFSKKKQIPLFREEKEFLNKLSFSKSSSFVESMKKLYYADEIDELYILYNKFFSVIKQKPIINRIFPVFPPEKFTEYQVKQEKALEYISEPSKPAILSRLIELYGKTLLYKAFCESVASEEGARMNAMKTATDNAEDMIANLTLSYNRVRQAAITKEIVEVIGTAEAL